jgi:hypothetical protein
MGYASRRVVKHGHAGKKIHASGTRKGKHKGARPSRASNKQTKNAKNAEETQTQTQRRNEPVSTGSRGTGTNSFGEVGDVCGLVLCDLLDAAAREGGEAGAGEVCLGVLGEAALAVVCCVVSE